MFSIVYTSLIAFVCLFLDVKTKFLLNNRHKKNLLTKGHKHPSVSSLLFYCCKVSFGGDLKHRPLEARLREQEKEQILAVSKSGQDTTLDPPASQSLLTQNEMCDE